jgi:hypothetical protein
MVIVASPPMDVEPNLVNALPIALLLVHEISSTSIDMFRVTLNGQRLLLIKYIQHLVLMAVYNVDFPHKIIKNEKIHSLLGKYCKTDQDNRVLTQNTCAGITCCMSIMFCAINSKILRQWKQEFYQRCKLHFYP